MRYFLSMQYLRLKALNEVVDQHRSSSEQKEDVDAAPGSTTTVDADPVKPKTSYFRYVRTPLTALKEVVGALSSSLTPTPGRPQTNLLEKTPGYYNLYLRLNFKGWLRSIFVNDSLEYKLRDNLTNMLTKVNQLR